MQLAVYKDNATGTWRVIYRFYELERGTKADAEARVCHKAGSVGMGA